MQRKNKASNVSYKIRKWKIWFWVGFVLLFLLTIGLVYYFTSERTDTTRKIISVGICGAVKHPAVYHIAEGSDLGQLIWHADGLTYCGDIRKLDLNKVVLNDTIYHIPCRGYGAAEAGMEAELQKVISAQSKANGSPVLFPDKGINQLSVLYVGFPAVYMLINYYPDQKRVSIVHLPHSMILLNSDARLIDIFFKIGIRPTINILETLLQQRIDYYIIQDRFSFIDLVNMLDGVDLPIDKPYADAYDLKEGNYHADGFYTWEYIRFLDVKRMSRVVAHGTGKDLVRNDNFKIPPKSLELAYELRQYRQRIVMNALRNAYAKINPAEQISIINKISKTFETDISNDLVLSLYRDVLSSPKFSFATIPGYYSDETDKLYYYPDIPGFQLLRNKEIRDMLQIESGQKQTTY